jgi:hypothetical protein
VPITLHQNETLKNAAYMVEEHIFNNCKLSNCRLIYTGGAFEFVNTTFENCMWGFRSEAAQTIALLMTIGMLKPGQAPPQSMQGTTGGPSGPQVH